MISPESGNRSALSLPGWLCHVPTVRLGDHEPDGLPFFVRDRRDYAARRAPKPAMNHDSYPDSYIRGILNTVKTIAMVGASEKENRPSYFAFKYLLERGYTMIPVNPGHAGEDMLGQRIYARLADIPEPVDMVDIFRGSQYALAIVQEALALKPRPQVIWMQLGVRNDEAAALAEANGMKVVMNRCPKIEYGRLSSEIAWMGVNTRTLSSKRRTDRRHPAHVAQPHQRPGRRHRSRRPRPARGRRQHSTCRNRNRLVPLVPSDSNSSQTSRAHSELSHARARRIGWHCRLGEDHEIS